MGVLEHFKALIQGKVERSWLRPLGAEHNIVCTVSVKLLPGGAVTSVSVQRCTGGDAAYMRSVELAVRKASPLPLPPDPRLASKFFSEDLKFTFKPSER